MTADPPGTPVRQGVGRHRHRRRRPKRRALIAAAIVVVAALIGVLVWETLTNDVAMGSPSWLATSATV
jgi:hypothetical protein